jgi:DNA-binding transcriptional ArsR family regulator
MIEFVLSDADLAEVRFAVSPLNELTLSLRVLSDPGRYPLHLRWLRRLLDLRPEPDMAVLRALTNERGWTPDFLSPRPESPFTRIEDEFARLRTTSAETVQQDLKAIHDNVPAVLADRERVFAALSDYWQRGLAGSWDRMRTTLQADIVYRGRVMAQAGLGAMLAEISDRISFDSPVVRVRIGGVGERRIETSGTGLTLMPTLFALHTAVPVDPAAPPMLIYAARGVGTLWETRLAPSSAALAGILGQVRADLLTSLAEPQSSTDIARRTNVTASAVNQHLRALRNAGLLTSYRHSRSVLYVRTELGDALILHSGTP